MSQADIATLRDAARMLRQEADCLQRAHTVNGKWEPDGEFEKEARESCRQMRSTAAKLTRLAKS